MKYDSRQLTVYGGRLAVKISNFLRKPDPTYFLEQKSFIKENKSYLIIKQTKSFFAIFRIWYLIHIFINLVCKVREAWVWVSGRPSRLSGGTLLEYQIGRSGGVRRTEGEQGVGYCTLAMVSTLNHDWFCWVFGWLSIHIFTYTSYNIKKVDFLVTFI